MSREEFEQSTLLMPLSFLESLIVMVIDIRPGRNITYRYWFSRFRLQLLKQLRPLGTQGDRRLWQRLSRGPLLDTPRSISEGLRQRLSGLIFCPKCQVLTRAQVMPHPWGSWLGTSGENQRSLLDLSGQESCFAQVRQRARSKHTSWRVRWATSFERPPYLIKWTMAELCGSPNATHLKRSGPGAYQVQAHSPEPSYQRPTSKANA